MTGPTAAILACTQGNEPAGLSAIDYLLRDLQLLRGRVLFILINPEAAKAGKRYIDKNMNRLPASPTDWAGTVEGARYGELLPILQEINGGVLDIHSTSAASPPMLIVVDETGAKAAAEPHSPFQHVVQGIERHLCGKFMIEACTQASLKWLAECGQHTCPEAASRAVEASLSFLYALGMVEIPPWQVTKKEVTLYQVQQALHLPEGCEGLRLIQPITPFEWVEKGQKIACNGSQQLEIPQSGYAIMCPATKEILDNREALLFLCEMSR